jgi:hypothetical protein
MGLKGFIRAVQADIRRAERESRRRQRELERQQKEYEKMQELQRAEYEVDWYNNKIELLLSVHKECGVVWDWEKIRNSKPPQKPSNIHRQENAHQKNLENYSPGFFTKLFGQTETNLEILRKKVEAAKIQDEIEYKNALTQYESDYKEWEETQALAEKICTGDTAAYLEAVEEINPFSEISQLGSSVKFTIINRSVIEIELKPNSEEVIPSDIKSLLKTGKLSVKKMPKSQFYELYQDYVCSCLMRVAREIFAVLPVEMAIVHVSAQLLNSKTGYMEDCTIVSAALPRKTVENLNFDMIDPSDSMENFVHNMKFKKQKGFEAVERIMPSNLQLNEGGK